MPVLDDETVMDRQGHHALFQEGQHHGLGHASVDVLQPQSLSAVEIPLDGPVPSLHGTDELAGLAMGIWAADGIGDGTEGGVVRLSVQHDVKGDLADVAGMAWDGVGVTVQVGAEAPVE